MVQKYPPTKDELKGRREEVPLSEIKFYELLDALSDEWQKQTTSCLIQTSDLW